jgi:hypothetical protein
MLIERIKKKNNNKREGGRGRGGGMKREGTLNYYRKDRSHSLKCDSVI